MKKILFVVPDRKMGGVSVVLEDILNNISLEEKQVDLLILNNEGSRLANIDKRINIIYGGSFFKAIDTPISSFLKKFDFLMLSRKLYTVFLLKTGLIKSLLIRQRKKILNDKYDVEVSFKDGFVAIFTSVGDTPQKIHWIHSQYKNFDPTRNYRKTFKNIYDNFDLVVSVSLEAMNNFNKLYHCEDKYRIIDNIIDTKKIKTLSTDKQKLSDREINIVSVGRLDKTKGYDILLQVCSRLKNNNFMDNVHITIIGEGPETGKLEALKKDLKLEKYVSFIGKQDNPYPYMAGANFYVSSSRTESFGLTLVEALIIGIPVLTVENAATSIIVENNVNGLIVPNSSDGLYEGLKKFINDREFVLQLKKNALLYDYESTNREIIQTIEKILND